MKQAERICLKLNLSSYKSNFIQKRLPMFGLFKKKSEVEKLDAKYRKLLAEAHQLSSTNRTMSDSKMQEADEVLKLMDKLNETH